MNHYHKIDRMKIMASWSTAAFVTASPLPPFPHWNEWRRRIAARWCETGFNQGYMKCNAFFWFVSGSQLTIVFQLCGCRRALLQMVTLISEAPQKTSI